MKTTSAVPDRLLEAIEKSWTHVFFVANPVNAMLARMIIDEYEIDEANVLCIPVRGTDVSIVSDNVVESSRSFFDRGLMKVFNYSALGKRIRNNIEKNNNQFIVYSSWMYHEVEKVVSSPLCAGHIYIEEGQQSYYESSPYPNDGCCDWSFRKYEIKNGSINYYFRDDFLACIGLSPSSFPKLDQCKRIVLKDFSSVKRIYKPQLCGVKVIGVMPAPRRIPYEFIEAAVLLFVHRMPNGGVIKLHPGFNVHVAMKEEVARILQLASNGKVTLCDDVVNLEIEMMFERKKLIGSRSSVIQYAEVFGSDYELVDFDGYVQPII